MKSTPARLSSMGGKAVHTVSPEALVERFGGNVRFWVRLRPRMVKSGLLRKIGKQFFGSLDDIGVALAEPNFPADPKANQAPNGATE